MYNMKLLYVLKSCYIYQVPGLYVCFFMPDLYVCTLMQDLTVHHDIVIENYNTLCACHSETSPLKHLIIFSLYLL